MLSRGGSNNLPNQIFANIDKHTACLRASFITGSNTEQVFQSRVYDARDAEKLPDMRLGAVTGLAISVCAWDSSNCAFSTCFLLEEPVLSRDRLETALDLDGGRLTGN